MAYTFFPESELDITKKLIAYPEAKRDDVLRLFMHLKGKHKTPINIDLSKQGNPINVSRDLQGDYSINEIKKASGISAISIKFGNGSSGNRGVANRGNLFEPEFAKALRDYWAGEPVNDQKMLLAIEDLAKTYKLIKAKTMIVKEEGTMNTKRPLQFAGNRIILKNPKGSGTDIGESVTDLTMLVDGKPVYLSLKLGTTVTFFNVGVRTILTPQEIKAYSIKNRDGLTLLKLFNIDPRKFCEVFNGDLKKSGEVQRGANFDRNGLTRLLESGIGHNYHVIHKLSGKVLSKKMDIEALRKASAVKNMTVYYGGKTGTGKRIDIEVESGTYVFKLNIRDTQGKDGYPTRLMCDFTYK
jgi:hypothetical protein